MANFIRLELFKKSFLEWAFQHANAAMSMGVVTEILMSKIFTSGGERKI
jgi:hypothetical protein